MNKLVKRFKQSFDIKHLKQVYFPNGKLNKKEALKLVAKTIGVFVLIVMVIFIWYSKDLPTPEKLKNWHPIESTHIYDRNGKELYDVSGNVKRTVISSNDIPQNIKDATVSAEDKNFYKNYGISFTGIARAFLNNIRGTTGYTSGGSTITQQFVKNALLDPKKTMTRKLKELILTLEIEAIYSKDEILTMYLNQIPYGSNAYGVEAAANLYFNKSAKDLTLDECATLAALPKAPTYYSPYGQHPDKLKERADYVLDRMVTLKYITSEQASEAKKEKITFQKSKDNITAAHFVFYVKEQLIDEYGEQMVNEGGLKVTTTLDLEKQQIAEEIIAEDAGKNQKKYNANNAALVSIDPKTGQILTMVGSKDFFDEDIDGQVNVATSERQPGSSFKPIAYATAFLGKYNPGYTLWDVKTDFGNYTPENYDGATHGPVSMRYALCNSLNIPAVKTLYLAGIDKTLEQAHKMGITTLNDSDRYGLSLVLGGGEVKLVDLTTAYGVFANSGVLHETTPILKVEDNTGKILQEYDQNDKGKEVLDSQAAYEITSILSDTETRKAVFGFASWFNIDGHNTALKTGTTQNWHDGWTVGYTPSVVTGVWVGNTDNSPMAAHADGSMVAAPIWSDYMAKILENTPNEDFQRPAGIQDVTVDKLSNKLPTNLSPQTITDIFATWQVPTKPDDIHVTAKVCQLCDDQKLATDSCPSELTDELVFTDIHSEEPNNPNWEQPVLAWARASGITVGSPPKEKCDIAVEKPTITIINPTQNQTVSGNFDCSVKTNSSFGIKNVEFFIDGNSIHTSYNEPYSTSYNANNLSSGSHTLKVKATDNKGLVSENSTTFNVTADKNPPANISGVSLSPGSKLVTFQWTNPSDSDLNVIRFYISTSSGNLGNLYPTEPSVSPGSVSSYTISGLTSGIKYYFTLHPVDNYGNENQSAVQFSTTPF